MIYFSERSFTSFHSVQDDRVGEVRMTPPPFRHSERSEESRSFLRFVRGQDDREMLHCVQHDRSGEFRMTEEIKNL